MELVSVTGAGTDSSQISKCLSHVRVNLGADCNVKLDSLSAGGSFLPSIFTDSSLETLTYDQFKECPASSAGTGTSATATPTVTGSFTGPGGLSTALLTEMKKFAYQGSRDYTVLTHIKVADGVVTVQNAPSSPTVVFKYAIKEVRRGGGWVCSLTLHWSNLWHCHSAALSLHSELVIDSSWMLCPHLLPLQRQGMTNTNVVVATGTDMAAGTEYQTVIGNQCSTGRYGQVVGSIKICFMCPSGTWGSGNGCTACAAGTSSAIVGQTAAASCAACSAGTYAHAGEARLHRAVLAGVSSPAHRASGHRRFGNPSHKLRAPPCCRQLQLPALHCRHVQRGQCRPMHRLVSPPDLLCSPAALRSTGKNENGYGQGHPNGVSTLSPHPTPNLQPRRLLLLDPGQRRLLQVLQWRARVCGWQGGHNRLQ